MFVTTSVVMSGAEKAIFELSAALKNDSYEVYILPYVSPFDEKYFEQQQRRIRILYPFRNAAIDTIVWKLNGVFTRLFNIPLRDIIYKALLKRYISKYRIKLIISNSYPADVFVFNATKPLDIQRIIVEHGAYSLFVQNGSNFNKQPLLTANEVVSVSGWCKDNIEKIVSPKRTKVISNAHVTNTGLTVNKREDELAQEIVEAVEGTFIIGMIGRGVEQKGWKPAINCICSLVEEGYNVVLVCIGEGPYLTTLRELHQDKKFLFFTGRVFEIERFVKHVHLGLVPSLQSEAFGIAILDFFQYGIPVVASNLGGIPGVVVSNKGSGGVLIPPGDEAKMQYAIKKMINDKDYYSKSSNAAKDIYSQYSSKRLISEYNHLIKQHLKL